MSQPFLSEACIIFSAARQRLLRTLRQGLWGWFVVCLAVPVFANPQTDSGSMLIVRPDHCVVSDVNALCDTEVEVSWRLSEQNNVCLSRSDLDKLLQCWQNSHGDSITLEIRTDQSVTFTLEEQASGLAIAEHNFKIITLQPKKRQARRNAWSFF